ncbi:hypothetical protein GCM10027614_09650 [Micromonospora vulcania]
MQVHVVPAIDVANRPAATPSSVKPTRAATRHDAALAVECSRASRCRPARVKLHRVKTASASAAIPRPRAAGSTQYDTCADASLSSTPRNPT